MRFISVLMSFVTIIAFFTGCTADKDGTDALPVNTIPSSGIIDSAASAVLYCPETKEVLYGHHIHEKRPIASITKIMTAVIALEYADKNDKSVTVTEDMYAEGSSMYLKAGEILRLSDLVRGMMLVSGNDAANAAAIAVAGSVEKFAELMNEKAEKIGMNNSHFVTASGLDDKMHYSTAYDMSLLCSYAMKNNVFRDIVSQKSAEIKYLSPEGKTQTVYNHNKLLSMCDGCIGIKTGYTKKAGRTLTSCCERNGVRLIAVTLNDGDDWRDHCSLYSYGFDLVESIKLCDESWEITLPLTDRDDETAVLVPEKIPEITVRKNNEHDITKTVYVPDFIYSPVVKNRVYGRAVFFVDGQRAAQCKLIAAGTRKLTGEKDNGKQ